MQQKSNQHGSGAIELLLLVAVMLLIAGTGAFLYSRHSHKATVQRAKAATVQPSGTSTTPNGVPPSGSTGSGTATELTFQLAALGISLKLPNEIKDLTYHYTTVNNVLRMTFSTTTLTKAVPACAADQNNGAFDIITRGDGPYPGPANPSSGGLLKQFPSYYVAYTLPNAPCAKGLSTENQALLDNQAQAFYTALTSLKTTQN